MSAIKRLQRDWLQWRESSRHFVNILAEPLEDDLFDWHFNICFNTLDAPLHGQIKFPPNYPFSPPKVGFYCDFPHGQVSFRRGLYEVCLDILQESSTQRFYSGWSSAYSVVSLFAQMQELLSKVETRAGYCHNAIRMTETWKEFRCSSCGHRGSHKRYFSPRAIQDDDRLVIPTTSRRLWLMLNRDVESVIFSFASQNDLLSLLHVNRHIEHVLMNLRVFHWTTIECYHSHINFGDFCKANNDPLAHDDDVWPNVFGIGFLPEYWVNERKVRNGSELTTKTDTVLKDIHVSVDTLSYHAFCDGVRFSMWKDCKFSHFFPLYLNSSHGRYGMVLAEKVIKESYQIPEQRAFDPILALRFLSKMMNTTVVSLMREVDELGEDNVQLFSSTKALQSYVYYYHMLLGFVSMYPKVLRYATKKVRDFLEKPNARNKRNFDDLGEFIVYLTIVDVPWTSIGPVIVHEAFVRNVKWILGTHPSLISVDKNTKVSCVRLRQTWEASVIGKRLTMFQVYFLKNVCGIGHGMDWESKLHEYNASLGQISEDMAVDLQRECRQIFQVDDWMQYFQKIGLPCPSARRMSHDLRLAMLESDAKGYHRFVKTPLGRHQYHEDSNLCMCSGRVMDLREANNVVSENTQRKRVDVAFSIDCTGSMTSILNSVKVNVVRIAQSLVEQDNVDVRFAVVGYRDHGYEMGDWLKVTNVCGFDNVDILERNVKKLQTGGGCEEEGVADAWYDVLKLAWRPSSVKAVIHLSDIGCHGIRTVAACACGHDPIQLALQMLERNICLYNVGCSLRGEESRKFYEGTSYMTGGLYVSLSDAAELPQIILESTREGLSLEPVVKMVGDLLLKYRRQRQMTRDQLAFVIWQDLVAENVVTEKIVSGRSGPIGPKSVAVSECTTLRECFDVLHGPRVSRLKQNVEPYMFGTKPKITSPKLIERDGVAVTLQHVTLDQTARCLRRAEKNVDRLAWLKNGCLYRMTKYKLAAANARYAEVGMEYDNVYRPIRVHKFSAGSKVEYSDHKSHRVYPASVTRVNKREYSFVVRVPGLNNLTATCPFTSQCLNKWGTLLTEQNEIEHEHGVLVLDSSLSEEELVQLVAEEERRARRVKIVRKPLKRSSRDCRNVFMAVHSGHLDQVRGYVNDPDLNAVQMTDARGRTLLHFAARAGSIAMVQLLIENGADPLRVDDQDQSARDALQELIETNPPTGTIDLIPIRSFLDRVMLKSRQKVETRKAQIETDSQKSANSRWCKLSVRNLPPLCTPEQLTRLLSSFDIEVVPTRQVSLQTAANSSRTFSFVSVEMTDTLADHLERMNGHMFRGAPVYVDVARRRRRRPDSDASPSRALFVVGFDSRVEAVVRMKINKMFGVYGHMERPPFVGTDRNGDLFAFVTFESLSSAVTAKSRLDGQFMDGRYLSVLFKKGDDDPAPGFGGRGRGYRSSRTSTRSQREPGSRSRRGRGKSSGNSSSGRQRSGRNNRGRQF